MSQNAIRYTISVQAALPSRDVIITDILSCCKRKKIKKKIKKSLASGF